MLGNVNLCIAGKNQCSIDFVKHVLNLKKKKINLLICPNESDKGKDGWQPSLRKFSRKNKLKIVNLKNLYKIKNLVFISIEYEKLIDINKFNSYQLYNFHFSLLPKYRGCHTNFYQVYKNEKNLGVTLHKIDQGIDTGPIGAYCKYRYNFKDNAKTNYIKLMNCAVKLFKKEFSKILNNKIIFKKQNLKKGSYFSKNSIDYKKFKYIKKFKSNLNMYNKIRALIFPPFQYPVVNNKEVVSVSYVNKKIILKFK